MSAIMTRYYALLTACQENGFIKLDLYNKQFIQQKIV